MMPMYEKIYGIDLEEGSEFDKRFVTENFSQSLIDLFWGTDFVERVYDGNSTGDPEYFGINIGVYDDVSDIVSDTHDMASIEQQYKERLAELETFLFEPESDDVPLDERKRFCNIVKDIQPGVFVITGTS